MFIPDIRRIYDRPWRNGCRANPSKIPTRIDVAVRSETTVFAHEAMLDALADIAAARASPTGIGRIDILDRNASSFGFVLDKQLKLTKGPAMESASHPLARLDASTNVRQILHHDFGDASSLGSFDNGFAYFVVNVADTPRLLARDLPQLLFCALAAVGLETATQGKVSIAHITQSAAAKDLAQTDGGEVVFAYIHAHHWAGCNGGNLVVAFNGEVEIPAPLAQHQLSLLGLPTLQDATLMLAKAHWDGNAPIQRVERNDFILEAIGACIEMHAGAVEPDDWNILADAPQCLLRLVCCAYRVNGVAGVGIGLAQSDKAMRLLFCYIKPDRCGAHHRLSPLVSRLVDQLWFVTMLIIHMHRMVRVGQAQFLPRLKSRVSLRGNL
ncbi:MAG: hypothetical protein N3A55_06070 [Methylohalobius sp.]|nr:hypothetical protein [Methylohalobius sp.]